MVKIEIVSKSCRVVLFLLILLFLLGCSKYGNSDVDNMIEIKSNIDDASAPSSPMRLDLSFSNVPSLGQTAEITAKITQKFGNKNNSYDTAAIIILPEGFELISGNPEWEGELSVIKPEINFSIIIKAIKTGNWTIEGYAQTPPNGQYWFGSREFIYISVMEKSAIISDVPFIEPSEPCEDTYIDGELVKCTTIELPTG